MRKERAEPLKADVAGQHLFQVAALFACQQRGRIDLGKGALGIKGVREQLAALHPVVDILQKRAEIEVTLPLRQQVQCLHDGKSGPEEGGELLVEDHELRQRHPAPPERDASAGGQAAGLNRENEVAELHKTVPDLGRRVAGLKLLQHVATLVRHSYHKFSHSRTLSKSAARAEPSLRLLSLTS